MRSCLDAQLDEEMETKSYLADVTDDAEGLFVGLELARSGRGRVLLGIALALLRGLLSITLSHVGGNVSFRIGERWNKDLMNQPIRSFSFHDRSGRKK